MQPRAYVPGLAAALLAALVTGCTSGTGTDGSAVDSKAGGTTTSPAPPGKYRTLPEPCGSVEPSTLKNLLPGVATLPEEQRQQVLRGDAAVTYDTDRRVACSWKGESPDASQQLRVDFERVVSYDPAISDDDRAIEIFTKKQASASVPIAAGPEETEQPEGSEESEESEESGKGQNDPSPDSSSLPGASPRAPVTHPESGGPEAGDPDNTPAATSSGSAEGLEPRALGRLGDDAFLDDVLGRAGSTAQRRTVSVVFRTSNVIVTIVYAEQRARTTEIPDSKELQEKARSLARGLAERLNI